MARSSGVTRSSTMALAAAAAAVDAIVLGLVLATCHLCLAQPPREAALCSGDACYSVHAGANISFEASQRRCRANGGHLTTVQSEGEAALLERLVSSVRGVAHANVWIGLRKKRKQCSDVKLPQRAFAWESGDQATGFSNWFKLDRHSCVQELCVYAADGLKWKVRECASHRNVGYACKYRYDGMCGPLDVLGSGRAEYATPFGVAPRSPRELPPGSTATVTCADGAATPEPRMATCRAKGVEGFAWSPDVFACGDGAAAEHKELEMSKPTAGGNDGSKVFVDDDDDEEDDDEDDDDDADGGEDADTSTGVKGLNEHGNTGDDRDAAPGDDYDPRGGDSGTGGSSKNVAIIAVVTLVLVTVIVAVLLVLLLRFCNKQRSHGAAKHKATKIPASKTEK
uniref:Complement component C1q receptor-like n=1 Tax=Petromyzon marinus TaxID=7757 RepID=A0AAJ7WX14_PETMA|nr:complement component C1q receptor-like [Petromyzon marinus]